MACSKCGGLGFLLSEREAEGVKGRKSLYTFADPCPSCRGDQRRSVSGVPPEFAEVSYPSFDWGAYSDQGQAQKLKRIVDGFYRQRLTTGRGLYLYSRTSGTGKTRLACSLLNSLMLRDHVDGRFLSMPSYKQELKKTIDRPETAERLQMFSDADVLVLDELGFGRSSEWFEENLFGLIEHRMQRGLLTMATSNLGMNELPYSDRLVSRLHKLMATLPMPEESIRDAQDRKADSEFFRQLMK